MSAKTKKLLVLFSAVLLLAAVGIITATDWSCHDACTGCTLSCDEPHEITECCGECEHSSGSPVYCCYPSQGCRLAI